MPGHMKRSQKRKSRRRSRKRRGGSTPKENSAEFRTCMADGNPLRKCMGALKKAEKEARKLSYSAFKKKSDKAAVKAVGPAVKAAEGKVATAMKSIKERKEALRNSGLKIGGKRRSKSKRRRSRRGGRKSRRKSRKSKRRRSRRRRR